MKRKLIITLLAAILWKLAGEADKRVQERYDEIQTIEKDGIQDVGIPLEEFSQEVD